MNTLILKRINIGLYDEVRYSNYHSLSFIIIVIIWKNEFAYEVSKEHETNCIMMRWWKTCTNNENVFGWCIRV